ncbi:MAG: hypothetical protein IKE89_03390 [Bacilli bacterium]|nr:hypothetical protein [Bacilli bacterium]MBR2711495.1 hypothetical protein [Bacilli bacterium]
MDIKKYITNKDIEITNDDINIEKLTNDLRKGYVESSEVDDKVKSAVAEANKTSSSTLADLQSKYDDISKKYEDVEARNVSLTESNKRIELERDMASKGFKKENFEEVSKLRNSLYADDDNDTALDKISEKFKGTYFPETNKVAVPNEPGFKSNQDNKPKEPAITRNTSIASLLKIK